MTESGTDRVIRLEREARKREISEMIDKAVPERIMYRRRRIGALYQHARLQGRSIQADGSLCTPRGEASVRQAKNLLSGCLPLPV